MASKPLRPPPSSSPETPAAKRPRAAAAPPSGPVQLNPADCNLDFDIERNGLEGHALHAQGFAYCWSGARATVGITGGKYCFGCKVISEQAVDMSDTELDQQHLCRVGISRGDDPAGNLGETMHSFGFGGTGKFSSGGKFLDYGVKFGVGDTLVCAVDLDSKPFASIGFSKNGTWLGIAKQFDAGPKGLNIGGNPLANRPWESSLFPHVLLKNVVVQLQFSTEDGLIAEEGYKPWSSALEDGNALSGPSFASPKECEVMMMIGLPASGKSTWAEKWVKDHPEKRYILLGTNLALEQMRVPGLMRKHNYGERFERLMNRATGIFNTLLDRAAKIPRNYILDQTNVFRNARNRKLRQFVNYRKIAVVMFPTPDELKSRAAKRFKEMGKDVPAEAVNDMLANFVLPTTKDMPGSAEFFDEVTFKELDRVEAQRHLDEMKRELKFSKSNAKDFSPYSRESSVQSFSSPSVVKGSAAAASGFRPTSQSPALLRSPGLLNPVQVNAAYSGSDPFGDTRRAGLTMPSNRSFGYSEYGRSSQPDPSGGYGVPARSPIPMTDAHCPYGSIDAFGRPNFESSNSVGRSDYGYSSSQSYSGPSTYGRDPEAYPVDDHAARTPSYDWRGPSQNHYPTRSGLPPCSSPGVAPYNREPGVPQAAREWQNPHLNAYHEPPPYNSPADAVYGRDRGVPQATREWQNPHLNAYHEPPPYNSPSDAVYGRDRGVPQAAREWQNPHLNAYHEPPPYNSPADVVYGRDPGVPQAARECQNPHLNAYHEPPPYNSPADAVYGRDPGVPQAAREWHSPHQNAYATPPPRPASGFRPPVNTPPGSWYR